MVMESSPKIVTEIYASELAAIGNGGGTDTFFTSAFALVVSTPSFDWTSASFGICRQKMASKLNRTSDPPV